MQNSAIRREHYSHHRHLVPSMGVTTPAHTRLPLLRPSLSPEEAPEKVYQEQLKMIMFGFMPTHHLAQLGMRVNSVAGLHPALRHCLQLCDLDQALGLSVPVSCLPAPTRGQGSR